ncbi:hypothetical protein [Bradyrhizobium sp. HKCCYLR20261]|uniref:hypothetical protein n=2 Tax=Bradyrhizobium TaxID=374 RepID=UPI003EB7E35E
MMAWTGSLKRACRRLGFAIAMTAGVLGTACPPVGASAHAQQRKKVPHLPDRTKDLLKRGYVALSGDDAINFLIGNSVLIRKSDSAPYLRSSVSDMSFYFKDRHTAYQCVGSDCWISHWTVDGPMICFEIPWRCDDPTYRSYSAPRLFAAPRPDKRTGVIGRYLTFNANVYAVVKANATIAPLIERPEGVGELMRVKSADFPREIETPGHGSGNGTTVPVTGDRAMALLIGNTFMSAETATDALGHVHACPTQGTYYAPDGRIIMFSCHHAPGQPDSWSLHPARWTSTAGGKFKCDDPGYGEHGCLAPIGKVSLAASDRPEERLVIAEDFPRTISGYAGNVFGFK